MRYPYVIVGGGLAGASAIEGIRAHDPNGKILLLSRENHPPYQRPPLSKGLWFGKTTLEQIPVHPDGYYREHGIETRLRRDVIELEPDKHLVHDDVGESYEYDHLLLATGGRPRLLGATNANLEGIHYFRYLEDYQVLRERARTLQHVLVVGGGFISIELAAALRHSGLQVTFIYPHEYPLQRVLPRDLGLFVAEYYRERGIETVSSDAVIAFDSRDGLIEAQTRLGNFVTTQLVVAGVGIEPQVDMADAAGLEVGNGIEVDEYARTSDPHIYAAGDVAEFPLLALDLRTRLEHEDHARMHGNAAGANMAGANQPYSHIPMFYSDFFDLGWEAVGDVDATLDVDVIWREQHREGMLFYLHEDVIRGVLLWNVWDKVDWARELIRRGHATTHAEREALVRE
jgi:3-phenylpropionate/trans-cinnamate dioxygenase ferredoxin reductase subunit